jgi:hypothetical protein
VTPSHYKPILSNLNNEQRKAVGEIIDQCAYEFALAASPYDEGEAGLKACEEWRVLAHELKSSGETT